MPAHRFALRSVQSLAELQELPLYLDTAGLFAEEISAMCGLRRASFTGSLILGELGNLCEVWVTANPDPCRMTARYKRVL